MLHNFYILPWRTLLCIMPIASVLLILLHIAIERFKAEKIARVVFGLLLAVWGYFLLRLTVFGRVESQQQLALLPFASYADAGKQPEVFRVNFMNIFAFFPGGMLLFEVLPRQWQNRRRCLWTVAAMLALSMFIEAAQYAFALGIAEMDDLIHNSLGAALGVGAAWMAQRISKRYPLKR